MYSLIETIKHLCKCLPNAINVKQLAIVSSPWPTMLSPGKLICKHGISYHVILITHTSAEPEERDLLLIVHRKDIRHWILVLSNTDKILLQYFCSVLIDFDNHHNIVQN